MEGNGLSCEGQEDEREKFRRSHEGSHALHAKKKEEGLSAGLAGIDLGAAARNVHEARHVLDGVQSRRQRRR